MSARGDDRPGCAQARALAPDVALGLLTGEERAEVLAHLEGCEACRAEVASLAVAADEVLLAAPEATPPAGFDTRVLAALAAHQEATEREGTAAWPARRYRRRRRAWAGAAAAAAIALIVGLVALVASDDPPSPSAPEPSAVATVAMRGDRGGVVGQATMTGSRPVQVVVAMPDWDELVERWGERPAGGGYWLVLETRDGARTMQEIREGEDDATEVAWTMAVDVAATEVAAVSVVDGDGRVWCSGRFAT